MQPGIRREFLKGEGKGGKGKGKGKGDEGEEEERAIKAFVEINKEGMLKTKPKVSDVLFLILDWYIRGLLPSTSK